MIMSVTVLISDFPTKLSKGLCIFIKFQIMYNKSIVEFGFRMISNLGLIILGITPVSVCVAQ